MHVCPMFILLTLQIFCFLKHNFLFLNTWEQGNINSRNQFYMLQWVQSCAQCAIPLIIPTSTRIVTLVTSHRTCSVQTCSYGIQSSTTLTFSNTSAKINLFALWVPPTKKITATSTFCISIPTVWNNLPSALLQLEKHSNNLNFAPTEVTSFQRV